MSKGNGKDKLPGACGVGVLHFVNGFLLTIGLITVIYGICVYFGVFKTLNTPKLATLVPQVLIILLILFGAMITIFAGVGLFGTICMRKATINLKSYNEQQDTQSGKKKHDAHCCATCTITLYIILTFVAVIFCVVLGYLAVVLSQGISTAISRTITGIAVDPLANEWAKSVDRWVTNNQNTTDWVELANFGKCCGWTTVANETIANGPYNGKCCVANATAPECTLQDSNADFGASIICNTFFKDTLGQNLVPVYITLFVFAFISLTCFISAIVVRCAVSKILGKKIKTKPHAERRPSEITSIDNNI